MFIVQLSLVEHFLRKQGLCHHFVDDNVEDLLINNRDLEILESIRWKMLPYKAV